MFCAVHIDAYASNHLLSSDMDSIKQKNYKVVLVQPALAKLFHHRLGRSNSLAAHRAFANSLCFKTSNNNGFVFACRNTSQDRCNKRVIQQFIAVHRLVHLQLNLSTRVV